MTWVFAISGWLYAAMVTWYAIVLRIRIGTTLDRWHLEYQLRRMTGDRS